MLAVATEVTGVGFGRSVESEQLRLIELHAIRLEKRVISLQRLHRANTSSNFEPAKGDSTQRHPAEE